MKRFYGKFLGLFKYLDNYLLILCIVVSAFSTLLLYSAFKAGFANSPRIFIIQMLSSALGILIAILIANIDYKKLAYLWKVYLPITILLVILTYFIGIQPEHSDDKAWLNLGIMTIQPAELLKFAFVLTFSLHLTSVEGKVNTFRNFTLLCLHGLAITAVVAFQGDLGTALIFFIMFVIMMFAGGLSFKLILLGLGILACATPFVWVYGLPDYLKMRFLVAYNPEIDPVIHGSQQLAGKLALSSGGFFGKGLFSKDLTFVSEIYNDFIFSHIGQTLGFVGCLFTILILSLICLKILLNAIKFPDTLGRNICIGVFAVIFSQSIINIGMVICLLPVIGVTLPFLSSGGSSVVTSYICLGLVLSVYKQNKKELFLTTQQIK